MRSQEQQILDALSPLDDDYFGNQQLQWQNEAIRSASSLVDFPQLDYTLPIYVNLQDIDNCDSEYIRDQIENGWQDLFDPLCTDFVVDKELYNKIANVFFSNKFLIVFISYLSKMNVSGPVISKYVPVINSLIYDYLLANDSVSKPQGYNIKNLLELAKVINRPIIYSMKSDPFVKINNITENDLTWITMGRYCGYNGRYNINIYNVTGMFHQLIIRDIDVYDDDMLKTIFNVLFSHLTNLFEGAMYVNASLFTGAAADEFNAILEAILIYLNDQDMHLIMNILKAYANTYYSYYNNAGYNVNLTTELINKYKNILNAVYRLHQIGIVIPLKKEL